MCVRTAWLLSGKQSLAFERRGGSKRRTSGSRIVTPLQRHQVRHCQNKLHLEVARMQQGTVHALP